MSPGLGALASYMLALGLLAGASENRVVHEPPLGQWRVARGEALGKPIPPVDLPIVTMTFAADGRWFGTENGAASGEGAWRVNEALVPATLDLTHTAGLDKGKTQLCIFAVVGDTLSVAFGVPGQGDRPTKLATTEGPPYTLLLVFVRTK